MSRTITLDEAGTIYIALYCDGLWVRVLKSEDAGITFAETSSPNMPVGGDASILGDMHILGGAIGEIFLAATADGSVVNLTKSVDGGQSWAPLVYVDATAGDYMAVRLINDALYLSFGGKLFRSEASGSYSSVSGGFQNEASGNYSSVIGGYQNVANGSWSSVTGGRENWAPELLVHSKRRLATQRPESVQLGRRGLVPVGVASDAAPHREAQTSPRTAAFRSLRGSPFCLHTAARVVEFVLCRV